MSKSHRQVVRNSRRQKKKKGAHTERADKIDDYIGDAVAAGRQGHPTHTHQTPQADIHSPSAVLDQSLLKKDASLLRGRAADPISHTTTTSPSIPYRAQSAHPSQPDTNHARSHAPPETKVSTSYGHHRQTSVIHGFQHSRNTSTNSPNTGSPLTPEVLGLGGGGSLDSAMRNFEASPSNPPNARNGRGQGRNNSATTTITEQQYQPPSIDPTATSSQSRQPTATARPGREHQPHAAHTRQKSEPRTPGEYALHHLLNAFVSQADNKINQCSRTREELNDPVEQLCGVGADSTFDQLIQALGHIARSKPKPLVDSLMYWRKAKAEAASQAKYQLQQQQQQQQPQPQQPQQLQQQQQQQQQQQPPPPPQNQQQQQQQKSPSIPKSTPPGLLRRNTEPTQPNGNVGMLVASEPLPSGAGGTALEEFILADRRATMSVYLVCRVLIEVFEQSSLDAITPDLAHKLEEIVFGQLKALDIGQITSSGFRLANWHIYSKLLGGMSKVDFSAVAHRFLHELDRYQRDLSRVASNSPVAKELENHIELLVTGMQHLQIRPNSDGAWSDYADFARNLGRLFASSHGARIKQAYCHLIERLLLPVASDVRNDLSLSRWKEFLDIVNPRLNQMLTKPRHWNTAYPLWSLLVCLQPRETFLSHWLTTVSNLGPKLRDRAARGHALLALCRLTWTYLYRYSESTSNTTRRLEDIVKLALPQGRKTHVSTEPFLLVPLIQLSRIIGFKYQELGFRTIIFPLLNSDLFAAGRDLKIEQLEPEKMVVGIRAFLALIADLEQNELGRPDFPRGLSSHARMEPVPVMAGVPPLPPLPSTASGGTAMDSALRLVNTSRLSDVARHYHHRFSDILGKIATLCDAAWGGQPVSGDKLSGTPKTPLVESFGFSKKDETHLTDQKQVFHDLLHVVIQALPRCNTNQVPFSSLSNLLCTGSTHPQSNIALSSSYALKAVAMHGHAQAVATGYCHFVFNHDLKYSNFSEEGMRGPAQIENTLAFCLDLLKIWHDEIQQHNAVLAQDDVDQAQGSAKERRPDMSNILSQLAEIESHGLFFLCSQSRRVRSLAIRLLDMVADLDKALTNHCSNRISGILQNNALTILNLNEDHLNLAERSRVQKCKQRSSSSKILLEICTSEEPYDMSLWLKAFPNFIKAAFQACPAIVALSRLKICDRLAQMQSTIEFLADHGVLPQSAGQETRVVPDRNNAGPLQIMIEQWKLYLIMACVTLNHPGAQSQIQLVQAAHARKSSKSGAISQDKMASARSLFSAVIPLLSAAPDNIRNAIVLALGSINKSLYRTLLESLRYAVTTCNDEAKARIGSHLRSPSSPARNSRTDRLRTEVTHVYKLTSGFLREVEVFNDDWILNNLVVYARDLRIFLSDAEVQNDWKFNRLRLHYCGLMEELFEGINRTKTPSRWLPFESRKSAFTLMEDWCGYPTSPVQYASKDDSTRTFGPEYPLKVGERHNISAVEEKVKTGLRVAALSAMAALCAGPITITTESKATLRFNLQRMLSWIESILTAPPIDRVHAIGRRALKELIVHNKEHPYIMEHAIERCYGSEKLKALESYFTVIAEVMVEVQDYPLPFWKVLAAVLFALGSESREIRMKSAHLLRTLEERQQKSSKLQDFDIGIADKTTAVYKLAQFEYSRRLSRAHGDLAFLIFSEFSLHYKSANSDYQRNMVAAILPWIQTMELQIDPSGGPTPVSYMLLSNLFEITVKSSNVLHNEVQALWQALATGPYGGNVQLILDFIILLSLERKQQGFVNFAKQIVVFLSGTPAGSKVIEFFILQLIPRNMVNEKKTVEHTPPDTGKLPYVADVSGMLLPSANKQVCVWSTVVSATSANLTPIDRIC